jgi:hypothetical protein
MEVGGPVRTGDEGGGGNGSTGDEGGGGFGLQGCKNGLPKEWTGVMGAGRHTSVLDIRRCHQHEGGGGVRTGHTKGCILEQGRRDTTRKGD